mgnify:CR=1 FL=1
MNSIFFICILIFIFVLFLLLDGYYNQENYKNKNMKNEKNKNNKNYLFPIKGLGKECDDDDLKPAYMPTVCEIDGEINSYANCKCVDKKTGVCKVCYPEIKKDANSRSVIYNAQDLNADSGNQ